MTEVKRIRELLTIEKFQSWLETISPDSWVGHPCCYGSYPIATYLEEITGTSRMLVDETHIGVWIDGVGLKVIFDNHEAINELGIPKMTDWLCKVMRKVNDLGKSPAGVSAKEVLQIVDEVAIALKMQEENNAGNS